MIGAHTQVCAVIGNPVEHSLSPRLHNAAFQALGLDYVYVAFRVEDVGGCMAGVRAMKGFRGVSVTIPHKIDIMPHLDAIDPIAKNVGSVNTVVNDDGRLTGLTTDGPGALRAFEQAGVNLEGKRVVILGAGGAVRAVAFALAHMGRLDHLLILGRTKGRVEALVRDLRAATDVNADGGALPEDVNHALASHEVIIQGTPLGMYPNSIDDTPVPQRLLRSSHTVFDMVYRPFRTRLLREAEEAGAKTIPGAEMLLYQAALQFEAWTGRHAPIECMRSTLAEALSG